MHFAGRYSSQILADSSHPSSKRTRNTSATSTFVTSANRSRASVTYGKTGTRSRKSIGLSGVRATDSAYPKRHLWFRSAPKSASGASLQNASTGDEHLEGSEARKYPGQNRWYLLSP